MSLLQGRRGVILGYSGVRSVAHELAKLFRAEGAEVALTSRPSRLESLRDNSAPLGIEHHLPLDALSEASIASCFERLETQWQHIDFVVHSLVHVPDGVLRAPLTSLHSEDFSLVMHAGVYSLIACARHARPLLARAHAPRLVTLSSELSDKVAPNYHVAGIAKAALEASIRYLGDELGKDGVLCNTLRFSALPTDGAAKAIGADAIDKTRSYLGKRSLTGDVVDFSDVAQSCAWLCSAELRNISGQVLSVDGGYGLRYL